MNSSYFTGVALAVLSGVFFQLGALLQKKAVNDLPREQRRKGFMKALVVKPVWIAGMVFQFILGAAAFIYAQKLIGPALVPGLTASGFIVLAVGSVKILGEKLNTTEYLGIFIMVIGIVFLGFSGLQIDIETVMALMHQTGIQIRIGIFTAVLTLIWGVLMLVSFRAGERKGIVMALSGGFPYGIMNFWINLIIASFIVLGAGNGGLTEIVFAGSGIAVMAITNVLGVWQMQVTFKYAQAANSVPVHSIAIQTAPIFVYFSVFSLQPENPLSGVYIVTGAAMIIISGFLLSRRKAQLDQAMN